MFGLWNTSKMISNLCERSFCFPLDRICNSVILIKGVSNLFTLIRDTAHFNLITYWENLEAIKDFAGQDFEKAKYYPEDDNSYSGLKSFQPHTIHQNSSYNLSMPP